MGKKKVNELKFENTQKEILGILEQFQRIIYKHFETVERKSKKLIEERLTNTT